MPAATLIVMTDASLKLATTLAGITAAPEFGCQVSTGAITAVPNLADVPATFCAPKTQTPAATGWTLDLTWLQDWRDAAGGLSGFAYTHDTELMFFELKLDKADTTPIATGEVRVVAGAYGGEAGVPLPASASWPIQGRPDITLPVTLAADAQDAADAEVA